MGDAFVPGPWTLGKKYKWINPAAIIWVAICVVFFCLPFTPGRRARGSDEFDWKAVNYAPLTVGVGLISPSASGGWSARGIVHGPGAQRRVRRATAGRRRRPGAGA